MDIFNINGTKTDKMIDPVRVRAINELDTLSFSLPGEFRDLIELEKKVSTPHGDYIIKDYLKGDEIEVTCKQDNTDLLADHRVNIVLSAKSLSENMAELLENTGWTAKGTDTTERRGLTLNQVNVFEAIKALVDKYGAEFRLDTKNKVVHYGVELGEDKGVYFAEDLNLTKIEERGESYDIITRLIPIGFNGLSINSVNGGKDYIENKKYSDKTITKYWRDERYTNVDNLFSDGQKLLNKLSTPRIVYDVDVRDLSYLSKYAILAYDIGDKVKIISKDIQQKHRIIKTVEYLNEPERNTCTLANRPVTLKETLKTIEKEMSDNWSRTEVQFEILDDRIIQAVTTAESYTDNSFKTYKTEREQTDREIRETITEGTTYVDPVTGETKPVTEKLVETVKDVDGVKTTAQTAKSKAEEALTADSYTRRIANTASDTASEAKQTADRVEIAFSNYSPDKIKYGTTYAITPSECYIAYNGTRKFSVSTSTGDVSTTGNFTSPYFIANSSGVTLKSKDGTTVLKPSQDRLEVWGLRTMNNVTMMGDIFMQGKAIYNGGLAIKFAYGTTYPIEMKQGVECFEGLYVHGSKNAILNTSTGYKGVTSYETAGYYFGDIGRGVISNQVDDNGDGFILISIDGIFAEIVNTQVEYNVFLTKEGKGDIWVAEKDPSFFIIKGTPGLPFSYEIKAKRKNYENTRLDPHNIDTTSKVNDGNPFDMTNQDLTINDMFFESEVTI